MGKQVCPFSRARYRVNKRWKGGVDMKTIFRLYSASQMERKPQLDRWKPTEEDKPALVEHFRRDYEAMEAMFGKDAPETRKALSFYNRVRNHPLSMTKADIQGYFLDMYESVSGHPEEYYADHPEWIRLINLTLCPQ